MNNKEIKIIGCSPRLLTEDGTLKQFINDTYVNALNQYGFVCIMLTLDNDNVTSIMDKCDGFLVTGGSDITPSCFGQVNNGSKGCDSRLDKLDEMIVKYAVNNKKPLLGICRGHQAINVFLGGTLIQDIGKSHSSVTHEVKTFKNRLVNFPGEIITVNSYHHQVVDKLAPGLIEIARSTDKNYNEAFIHESLPIISFQWHPEKSPETETSKIIFNTFKSLF